MASNKNGDASLSEKLHGFCKTMHLKGYSNNYLSIASVRKQSVGISIHTY